MTETPVIEGRKCSTCTLCCKVLSITEIDKPQGTWCTHCAVGRGCRVYEDRPAECARFYCGYLTWPMVGEHWFPARSKMVIVSELEGTRIAVHVDPGKPGAWREPLFYSDLKTWARYAAGDMKQIVVCIGKRAVVILPDRDVDLGLVADDERIITFERRTRFGVELDALKLKANDPRLAGMGTGKILRGSASHNF